MRSDAKETMMEGQSSLKAEQKRIVKPLTMRIVAAVIIVQAAALAALAGVAYLMPPPEGSLTLERTIGDLERAVSRQEAIVSSIREISRLARRSGYELTVRDIVRDHERSMDAIRSDLAALRNSRERRTAAVPLVAVIAVIALQGLLLLGLLYRFMGRVLAPMKLLSRRMDGIMARKNIAPGETGRK